MKLFLSKAKHPSRRWLMGLGLLLLALALTAVMIAAALGSRLAPHVRVGGLDIGGRTLQEAYHTLKKASEEVLESTWLEVETLDGSTIPFSPAETKVSLNCFSALWEAYQVGRVDGKSHSIWLQEHLKLDEAYIRQRIDLYADDAETELTPPQVWMAGPAPDLEIENQSSENRPQTLELTMGLPTTRIDREHAFQQILALYDCAFSAAEEGHYRVENPFLVEILEEPEMPDLKAIYDEYYIPPVDDSLNMEKYEVIPGAFGYHFDLEKARKQVDQAGFGETVYIPMEWIEPDIFGDGVYFRDVLGYCETPHTQDENRNNNLRVACKSLNGVVLQPGETFSYNETLGQRTKENGYLRAGAYSGWELVQSYGGGICQVSSTVYCATLYADLEIVHRVNHGMKVGYMEPGLDATVSWWGPDFQFRNNTHFPIKLAAEVSDDHVKITILGTEERDYYVEMETESSVWDNVLYARSYKCKYDRKTGELISRDLEARSNYALY